MYILLIILHSLFIFICHLFGFYVIEGVFLILMLFFLLYFSPIFFFKNSTGEEWLSNLFSFELSPQKSLIVPLVLTYLGVYILAFTFSGTIAESIHAHLMIFLAIFTIFLGYIFAFSWKNEIFFDILGFHLIFSYITIVIVGIYYFFARETINLLDMIFSAVTMWFSYFFFRFETKYRKEFFYGFLASIFFSLEILLIFLFREIPFYLIIGALSLLGIILFELSEKSSFFDVFLNISRVFFLSVILASVGILSVTIFSHFASIYFLIIIAIFLFSVHIRFSNLVTYSTAIFIIYFMYGFVFLSLLSTNSVLSSLMFIFFFPILIITNTYFWEEKQQYDFAIMHYASIAFSGLFFLYALIFMKWEASSFVFSSFGFFLLAGLFFLSYFRFRTKK